MPTKPQKKARGRPQVLSDDTKTITVRVLESTYSQLKKCAGQRMADTGKSCTVSDVVRGAMDRELAR